MSAGGGWMTAAENLQATMTSASITGPGGLCQRFRDFLSHENPFISTRTNEPFSALKRPVTLPLEVCLGLSFALSLSCSHFGSWVLCFPLVFIKIVNQLKYAELTYQLSDHWFHLNTCLWDCNLAAWCLFEKLKEVWGELYFKNCCSFFKGNAFNISCFTCLIKNFSWNKIASEIVWVSLTFVFIHLNLLFGDEHCHPE